MKYEAGAKKLAENSSDLKSIIEMSKKQGESDLKVQIAQLGSDLIKAEMKVSKAELKYQNSKFMVPFSIEAIDAAEFNLEEAKHDLEMIQDDIKNRESLLKELF